MYALSGTERDAFGLNLTGSITEKYVRQRKHRDDEEHFQHFFFFSFLFLFLQSTSH